MRRKELFYCVTWGSNVTRDVHWCVTVFYQPIENDNIANQIHGFTMDDGKFIRTLIMIWLLLVADITLALISYRYLFPMSSWWSSKQYHNNVLYVFPSQGKALGTGLRPRVRICSSEKCLQLRAKPRQFESCGLYIRWYQGYKIVMRENIWKTMCLNYGQRGEGMMDHRNYTHNC